MLWELQFMNPKMMVKKGGRCPDGNINDWFFEGNGLQDHVSKKLPKETASKLHVGKSRFGKYPENLLNSRRRFGKAFQVQLMVITNMCLSPNVSTKQVCGHTWIHYSAVGMSMSAKAVHVPADWLPILDVNETKSVVLSSAVNVHVCSMV